MTRVIFRTLRCAVHCTLPLWIWAAAPLIADVTVRYQTDIKVASFLPPQAREQAEKAWQGNRGYLLRFKDGKGWTDMNSWTSLLDYTTQQMTLIDSAQKTFCTLPLADFTDKLFAAMPKFGKLPKMENVPEEQQKAMADTMAKMMANLKVTFDSKKTGRTDTIQGIVADERELTIAIEMPMPAGSPQSVMHMKIVMQVWGAQPGEALKNQAIRELAGYNLYANYFMNPAGMLQKMFSGMPGYAEALKSMTEEFSAAKSPMLRMRMSMFVGMPPDAVRKSADQSPGAAPIDPNAPMFEITQEAVEISSALLDEAAFRIPADYKAMPAEEIIRNMMRSQMAMTAGTGH